MIYGSVCSGIEAVTLAWHPLGFEPAWFVEIDSFCSALLAHRYPHVSNVGDFRDIGPGARPIDILVAGTPCQAFSCAGRRAGLADPRGNLAIEFCRLAGRLRPRWVVWENVPGVLSSNRGRDFGAIIGALVKLGYGCAWRVLDAQYFGVPQRRRRVFVVGHLGDWRSAAAVLFERESLRRNPTPGKKAKTSVAALTANGVGTCGADDNQGQAGHLIPRVAETLRAGANRTGGDRPPGTDADTASTYLVPIAFGGGKKSGSIEVATTLSSRATRQDFYTETLIAFSSKQHAADAGPLSPTLRAMPHDASHANGGGQVAIAFSAGNLARREGANPSADIFQTLRADCGDNHPCVMRGLAVRRLMPRECERLQGMPDDYTLIPYRGRPASDGPRYRAIGNSMAVPVMRWVGDRIQAVDGICN
ncbi:MAG: DNA cytosine methyltransferase [Acidobacteria bacterium]|nr:DNA cytosine methyltransferase [Acidobacteriota bacterium]